MLRRQQHLQDNASPLLARSKRKDGFNKRKSELVTTSTFAQAILWRNQPRSRSKSDSGMFLDLFDNCVVNMRSGGINLLTLSLPATPQAEGVLYQTSKSYISLAVLN